MRQYRGKHSGTRERIDIGWKKAYHILFGLFSEPSTFIVGRYLLNHNGKGHGTILHRKTSKFERYVLTVKGGQILRDAFGQ
jgi:hypothetical protein